MEKFLSSFLKKVSQKTYMCISITKHECFSATFPRSHMHKAIAATCPCDCTVQCNIYGITQFKAAQLTEVNPQRE